MATWVEDNSGIVERVVISGSRAMFTIPFISSPAAYSYDYITPTAAIGALRAAYAKPAMKYVIKRIYLLSPVKRASRVVLNGSDKFPFKSERGELVRLADGAKRQYSEVPLMDVRYGLEFEIMIDKESGDFAEYGYSMFAKHRAILHRRFGNPGSWFRQPCLGKANYFADMAMIHDADEWDTLLKNNLQTDYSCDIVMPVDSEIIKTKSVKMDKKDFVFRAMQMISGVMSV